MRSGTRGRFKTPAKEGQGRRLCRWEGEQSFVLRLRIMAGRTLELGQTVDYIKLHQGKGPQLKRQTDRYLDYVVEETDRIYLWRLVCGSVPAFSFLGCVHRELEIDSEKKGAIRCRHY